MIMRKRLLLAGLFTLPFFTAAANANSNKSSATWKVPPGVKKIRVRSWNADGTPDLDRTLRVEPNQTFRIDAIED
jgi:hypothetical protein